ncbi:hypothetical protein XA68_15302 [Ophiocordyceps unilateralis]|uniref:Uncharacterized protein n=1 Tax=Ophiocordyceps unilateralis TaxID=268505 RepID=A0A2A9P747_OPHUN|nr:hypothetical protein XA68_15302 [Ophiocordyceps unilateralis]
MNPTSLTTTAAEKRGDEERRRDEETKLDGLQGGGGPHLKWQVSKAQCGQAQRASTRVPSPQNLPAVKDRRPCFHTRGDTQCAPLLSPSKALFGCRRWPPMPGAQI